METRHPQVTQRENGEMTVYYVVATFYRHQMASIHKHPIDAERLRAALEREGIPSISGQADSIEEADRRFREALPGITFETASGQG